MSNWEKPNNLLLLPVIIGSNASISASSLVHSFRPKHIFAMSRGKQWIARFDVVVVIVDDVGCIGVVVVGCAVFAAVVVAAAVVAVVVVGCAVVVVCVVVAK